MEEANLDEKTLRLCLKYKRCKECGRVMPRRGNIHYCPLCRHLTQSELKIRHDFLRWYEVKGRELEDILPKTIPKGKEIFRMIREREKRG